MSVNYASGLSFYKNKGVCGKPETFDPDNVLLEKIQKLVNLVKRSTYLVVHTGAGVSTSVGIPDFRGPNGVWTLEKLNKVPKLSTSFECAVPSLTHISLVELEKRNIVKFLITQNVDGLHLRSGFPRDRLAMLHGDMFLELCSACNTLFARIKPTKTLGLRRSNVLCTYIKSSKRPCRGKLSDTILDWEDDLPVVDYNLAIEHSKKADLHICIGSSLQMLPAAELPLFNNVIKSTNIKKFRHSSVTNVKYESSENSVTTSKLVIINLQQTKLDRFADLVINAPADNVMPSLCEKLGVPLPPRICKDELTPYSPVIVLRSMHSYESTNPFHILPHPLNDCELVIRATNSVLAHNETFKQDSGEFGKANQVGI